MTLREVNEILGGRVVCGEDKLEREVEYGFASDLMSDVLTLNTENLLLLTGLTNLQAIRTSEMSEITNIVFVRNKKVNPDMVQLAKANDMVLIECASSMFKCAGKLYQAGLKAIY